ncbi:MAG: hypothetical protein B7733_21965 [Myxococcales bacterium FL481]|nr:MAG: hypothetical protein B7733_21965 [Myxococcales bacterium FL481]
MGNHLPPLIHAYVQRYVPETLRGLRRTTLLHQTGEIRLAPDRDWIPFTAEQTIESTRTEFVWHARFKMAPLLTGVVEDAFESGEGRLDAKIWGMIPVAHARGVDVDRGEAQRYLSELAWCPTAFELNPELNYIEVDERTVRVWVHDEQTYVDLLFGADGELAGARTTTRVRGDVGPQPWEGHFSEYRDFGGIQAPARGEVWWDGPDGRFLYWRGEVVQLQLRESN